MRASSDGPALCLTRSGHGVRMVKPSGISNADMTVTFRSMDAAFLVLSGQIGVAQAYAQHRFALRGSIYDCMTLVHCVDIIESYLFPKFITRKILKRISRKECPAIYVYCRAILGG